MTAILTLIGAVAVGGALRLLPSRDDSPHHDVHDKPVPPRPLA